MSDTKKPLLKSDDGGGLSQVEVVPPPADGQPALASNLDVGTLRNPYLVWAVVASICGITALALIVAGALELQAYSHRSYWDDYYPNEGNFGAGLGMTIGGSFMMLLYLILSSIFLSKYFRSPKMTVGRAMQCIEAQIAAPPTVTICGTAWHTETYTRYNSDGTSSTETRTVTTWNGREAWEVGQWSDESGPFHGLGNYETVLLDLPLRLVMPKHLVQDRDARLAAFSAANRHRDVHTRFWISNSVGNGARKEQVWSMQTRSGLNLFCTTCGCFAISVICLVPWVPHAWASSTAMKGKFTLTKRLFSGGLGHSPQQVAGAAGAPPAAAPAMGFGPPPGYQAGAGVAQPGYQAAGGFPAAGGYQAADAQPDYPAAEQTAPAVPTYQASGAPGADYAALPPGAAVPPPSGNHVV